MLDKTLCPQHMSYVCYAHSVHVKLHTLFWTAFNAYTEHVHKKTIEVIKKESVATYEWLLREPVQN